MMKKPTDTIEPTVTSIAANKNTQSFDTNAKNKNKNKRKKNNMTDITTTIPQIVLQVSYVVNPKETEVVCLFPKLVLILEEQIKQ